MPPITSPSPVVIFLTASLFVVSFGHRAKIFPWLEAEIQQLTTRAEVVGLVKGFFNGYGVVTLWRIFSEWRFPVPPLPDTGSLIILLIGGLGLCFYLIRRWWLKKVINSLSTPGWKDDYPMILEITINTLSCYGVLNDVVALLSSNSNA